MAKRKYGDGSVFQRKDGRWEGRLVVGYKENGYAKERFGMTIDRVGFDKLEAALFSNDLIERKAEILAAEILQK